jgi:hypothetical protein
MRICTRHTPIASALRGSYVHHAVRLVLFATFSNAKPGTVERRVRPTWDSVRFPFASTRYDVHHAVRLVLFATFSNAKPGTVERRAKPTWDSVRFPFASRVFYVHHAIRFVASTKFSNAQLGTVEHRLRPTWDFVRFPFASTRFDVHHAIRLVLFAKLSTAQLGTVEHRLRPTWDSARFPFASRVFYVHHAIRLVLFAKFSNAQLGTVERRAKPTWDSVRFPFASTISDIHHAIRLVASTKHRGFAIRSKGCLCGTNECPFTGRLTASRGSFWKTGETSYVVYCKISWGNILTLPFSTTHHLVHTHPCVGRVLLNSNRVHPYSPGGFCSFVSLGRARGLLPFLGWATHPSVALVSNRSGEEETNKRTTHPTKGTATKGTARPRHGHGGEAQHTFFHTPLYSPWCPNLPWYGVETKTVGGVARLARSVSFSRPLSPPLSAPGRLGSLFRHPVHLAPLGAHVLDEQPRLVPVAPAGLLG